MEKISHVDLNNLSGENLFYIKQAYQVDFNIYYSQNKNQLNDQEVVNSLNNRREDYLKKISNLGEKHYVNNDKFILVTDNILLGYCKYQIAEENIKVDSIYGTNKEVIKLLLKELGKYKKYYVDNAICNLDLNQILEEIAKTIKIEDFVNDPDLLTKLTKNQLIEIVKSIKEQQNHFHDASDFKVDSSEADIKDDKNGNLPKQSRGHQKNLNNGHSLLENDKSKQGFVDAFVLALLSGFVSGIITTLVVLFIKIKTGI